MIRPRNMPKNADWGVKMVKSRVLKNGPTGPTKVFLACTTYDKPKTIEKTELSHQVWSHGGSTFNLGQPKVRKYLLQSPFLVRQYVTK